MAASVKAEVPAVFIARDVEAEILLDGLARFGIEGFIDQRLEVVDPRESRVCVEEKEIVGVHD